MRIYRITIQSDLSQPVCQVVITYQQGSWGRQTVCLTALSKSLEGFKTKCTYVKTHTALGAGGL